MKMQRLGFGQPIRHQSTNDGHRSCIIYIKATKIRSSSFCYLQLISLLLMSSLACSACHDGDQIQAYIYLLCDSPRSRSPHTLTDVRSILLLNRMPCNIAMGTL